VKIAAILALSIGLILILILTVSILCILTGDVPRSYPVLKSSDSVVVAGKTISLNQLTSTFKPQLLLLANDNSPPILTIWWEAVDVGNFIGLVYHPVWQDERHPKPILHNWVFLG